MKTNVTKVSVWVLVVTSIISLSGCTAQQQSKIDQKASSVEIESSKNIKVLWADQYQVDDKVVIVGAFRRDNQSSIPMKAHIDVQVVSADGQILQHNSTPEMSVPRNLLGKGIKFERFEVELPDLSATNSTIVVSAHQGQHDA